MGYYDEISPGYEALHREEQASKLNVILTNLPFKLTRNLRLLDIGCGSGISLEPWTCEKVGIDPSAQLVELARGKGFEVLQGMADDLPFSDNEFDIVIAITSLHHVDYPDDVAAEINRVCKRWLIVSYLKKASVTHREQVLGALLKYFVKEKVVEHEQDVIYFLKKK